MVGVGCVGLGIALVGCVGRSEGRGGSETGGSGGSTGVVPVPTSGGGETSSGVAGSATGDVGSTSGESGAGFISKPDAGMSGRPSCDVWAQDCDEGEKCAAWAEGGSGAWNATKCVEVMGDRQPGEACMVLGGGGSGMDDCAKGAMCWDVSAENVGVCVPLCAGAPEIPICPGKLVCWSAGDGALNLCFPSCDPLIQDCPGDQICVLVGDEVDCMEDASGEMGAVNEPCELANECDKGLACVDADLASSACMQGAMRCCQPFCEFIEGEDGACPNPDQVCLQLDVLWGLDNRGVCGVPG